MFSRDADCPLGCHLLLSWSGALAAMFGVAVLALGTALIAQYGFGFAPCVLCLWQRIPYVLVLVVAGAGFAPGLRRWRGALLLGCGLLLLIECGIAMFHVGVEQHWWLGTSGCSLQATATPAQDTKSLREMLLATPVAQCDRISWTFLGLSMATWNVAFALVMGLYALYVVFMGRADGTATQTQTEK